MQKKITFILLAFMLVLGCKKDLNFDKFNDLTLNPEFGVPLAVIEMKMSNLLKQDSVNIFYDPDGFIRFIYSQDSIASFPVDSFVNLPALPPVNISNKLGLIDIDNVSITESKTLGQLSSNFSSTTKQALDLVAGTVSIFPAINDQNPNTTQLDLNTSQFSNIDLASGYLVLEFKNQLKVTVDQITINIFNTVPFQTLVGQLVYRNVAPNGSKRDSINMTGLTLSSDLAYSLPVFKTLASSSPVLIDLNDGVRFDVSTRDMKAIGGSAVFPNQTINPQVLDIDLGADDSTIRIRNVGFESGLINYSLSSNIQEQLSVKITIEGATKNSAPLAPIIIAVRNETKSGTINLANVIFDLTKDVQHPYNKLRVTVEPNLISSNSIKPFDSSNFVNATFSFGTLKFNEINGYLGSREIEIEPSEESFDLPEQFNSGFPLDDPKIKIFTSNSIGVPVTVFLNAEGTSAKGKKQNLNAQPFVIGYPTIPQKGQTISETKVFDKNNSSLLDLLNLPPTKILFSGKASLNAGGFNGYNDFIVKGSAITVGYEVELPMSLKTNNLLIEQVAENALFKVENGQVQSFAIDGLEPDQIEFVELVLKMNNGIPFDANLDLYFADKDTIIKDSIIVGSLMKSALADANGKATQNTVSYCSVKLTGEQIKAIKEKNLINMVVRINISTFNNGTAPVKLYANYTSKIGMSAKLKLKIKAGSK